MRVVAERPEWLLLAGACGAVLAVVAVEAAARWAWKAVTR